MLLGTQAMLYEALPKPPGTSSFRVKGLAYRGFFAYANKHVADGMERIWSAMPEPDLRAFFAQPFLAGTLYDVLPVIPLASVIAHIEKVAVDELARRTAKLQAVHDVQGVYKRFVQGRDAASFVPRIPKFIMQYTDFGSVEQTEHREADALFVRTGVPKYIVPWFLPMNEAYMEAVLHYLGSHRARVRGNVGSLSEASSDGLATVTLRFRVQF